MSKYPAEIEVGESRLEHDRRRVLVAFAEPMDREEALEAVDQLGLQLEPDEVVKVGGEEEETEQWTRRVGHTNTHFFFQAGEEIDDDRYEDLTNVDGVTGIVPIYRRSGTSGLSGLSAVFPTDVAIEYADGVDEATAEEIEANHDLRRMGEFDQGWVRYELSDPTGSAFEVAAALSGDANPDVVRTEYNTAPVKSPLASAPNDPRYPQAGAEPGQWNLKKINWDQIWNTTGHPNVVIGILDTGVQSNHEEFGSRVRTPTGWSGDPDTSRLPVDRAHGTRVAGVAAARADNGLGIAGIAGGCELYPIALPEGTDGKPYTPFGLADAIVDAVAANVSVINISQDLGEFNGYLKNRITANVSNAVFCVAAGDGDTVGYPAKHDDVISVGAIDVTETLFASPPGARVVAPGKDIWTTDYDTAGGGSATDRYYGNFEGTSAATPHVAGVAALVRSEYPGLTAMKTRDVIKATCKSLPSGERLIDARKALVGSIAPVSSTLTFDFGDVQRGEEVTLDVEFEAEVPVRMELTHEATDPTYTDPAVGTFAIDVPASSDVEYDSGTGTVTMPTTIDTTPNPPQINQEVYTIPIKFTARNPGDVTATFTFTCIQTGETFVVELRAKVMPAAIVLVLDESGSMVEGSGIPGKSRMDKLKQAVDAFNTLVTDADAVGLVSFSTDIEETIDVERWSTNRTAISNEVNSLQPKQYTALWTAVEGAVHLLREVDRDEYGTRAIVLLTDGRKNTGIDLADLSVPHWIEKYAIGMGTAEQVDGDRLKRFVGGTSLLENEDTGYSYVTGQMGSDDEFTLEKIFQEVFKGVAALGILLDPEYYLEKCGDPVHEPFVVSEADAEMHVLVLVDAAHRIVDLTLVAPNGEELDPEAYPPVPGTTYRTGQRAMRYTVPLPVETGDGEVGPGEWEAVLQVDEGEYVRALGEEEERDIHCNLSVHVRSDIQMTATIAQDTTEPGARMVVRARVTENGRPLERGVGVRATVGLPDGGRKEIELEPARGEDGVYEEEFAAKMSGTHHFHLVADGESREGHEFKREHRLDGIAFQPEDLSDDERRRDDVVDRDRRRDEDEEDDGPEIDIGTDDIIGRIGRGVRPPIGGWTPIIPDYRLLRRPEYVDALADISRLLREVEAEEDEDEDDR